MTRAFLLFSRMYPKHQLQIFIFIITYSHVRMASTKWFGSSIAERAINARPRVHYLGYLGVGTYFGKKKKNSHFLFDFLIQLYVLFCAHLSCRNNMRTDDDV